MTPFQKQVTEDSIEALRKTLTGDMLIDMAVRDEIHDLEMVLNGISPNSGDNEECLFCGS